MNEERERERQRESPSEDGEKGGKTADNPPPDEDAAQKGLGTETGGIGGGTASGAVSGSETRERFARRLQAGVQ